MNRPKATSLRRLRDAEDRQFEAIDQVHDELYRKYKDLQQEANQVAQKRRQLEDQLLSQSRKSEFETEACTSAEIEVRELRRHSEDLQALNQSLKTQLALQRNTEDAMFKCLRQEHEEEMARMFRDKEALKTELASRTNAEVSAPKMHISHLPLPQQKLINEFQSKFLAERRSFQDQETKLELRFNTRLCGIIKLHKRVEKSLKSQLAVYKQEKKPPGGGVLSEQTSEEAALQLRVRDCERVNDQLSKELQLNKRKLRLAAEGFCEQSPESFSMPSGMIMCMLSMTFSSWANTTTLYKKKRQFELATNASKSKFQAAQCILAARQGRCFEMLLFQAWLKLTRVDMANARRRPDSANLELLECRHESLLRDHDLLLEEHRELTSARDNDTEYLLREYLSQHLTHLRPDMSFTPSTVSSAPSRRGDGIREERTLQLQDLKSKWSEIDNADGHEGKMRKNEDKTDRHAGVHDQRRPSVDIGNRGYPADYVPINSRRSPSVTKDELDKLLKRGQSLRGKLRAKETHA